MRTVIPMLVYSDAAAAMMRGFTTFSAHEAAMMEKPKDETLPQTQE